MPYQAQQIVTLACQTAKVPAWTTQGGQLLNFILSELCQTYDLAAARKTYNFSFNSSNNAASTAASGSGPYPLPTDWLRPDKNDVFYVIDGVPYVMIPQSLAWYNAQVQQAGLENYPQNYAIDMAPIQTQTYPLMYVWMPASGSYPVTAVYYSQMPDITNPQSSSTIPWFPNQTYLIRRLTGELMEIAGDDRAARYLGGVAKDGFEGAVALLDRYLKLQDDKAQVVQTVSLDRRRFGLKWDKLPFTKTIGW